MCVCVYNTILRIPLVQLFKKKSVRLHRSGDVKIRWDSRDPRPRAVFPPNIQKPSFEKTLATARVSDSRHRGFEVGDLLRTDGDRDDSKREKSTKENTSPFR